MTKTTITWPPAENSCATAKDIYFITYIFFEYVLTKTRSIWIF